VSVGSAPRVWIRRRIDPSLDLAGVQSGVTEVIQLLSLDLKSGQVQAPASPDAQRSRSRTLPAQTWRPVESCCAISRSPAL